MDAINCSRAFADSHRKSQLEINRCVAQRSHEVNVPVTPRTCIIQGWSMKHVAVAHDLFSNNTKTLASLAGKVFHVDVIQNVILSIIRSYPERFYKV